LAVLLVLVIAAALPCVFDGFERVISTHRFLQGIPLLLACKFGKPYSDDVYFGDPSKLADSVEVRGGNGPSVVAYSRVSTPKQVKRFSLKAQHEALSKMRMSFRPSRIYWFSDPGKSSEDFDKRKINAILKLKEDGKVQELWIMNIDRLGRDCRKLIYFFLQFCDEGGVLRTPDGEYSLADLAKLLLFILKAHAAQEA
jgi:hypothetical protein